MTAQVPAAPRARALTLSSGDGDNDPATLLLTHPPSHADQRVTVHSNGVRACTAYAVGIGAHHCDSLLPLSARGRAADDQPLQAMQLLHRRLKSSRAKQSIVYGQRGTMEKQEGGTGPRATQRVTRGSKGRVTASQVRTGSPIEGAKWEAGSERIHRAIGIRFAPLLHA